MPLKKKISIEVDSDLALQFLTTLKGIMRFMKDHSDIDDTHYHIVDSFEHEVMDQLCNSLTVEEANQLTS